MGKFVIFARPPRTETGIDKATKTRYTGEKSKNEVEKWYNAMNAAPCTRKQCAAAQTAAAKIQLAPNSEFEEPKKPYVQPYRPYGMPMNNRMNGYAVAGFVLSCVALVLMCVFPPLSILGIVFSALGLSQIKKSFQRGKGLSVAGLTIGMITTVFSIFLYAMVFIESLW